MCSYHLRMPASTNWKEEPKVGLDPVAACWPRLVVFRVARLLAWHWAPVGKGKVKMATVRSRILEDVRIGVRLKISALWVAMLFLFAYGDIFGFFQPGHIEEVTAGGISGIEITQAFLLAISVYIAIASVMVFLTLVLKPSVNRWINIVLPILYVVSIAASVIGETWAYFLFLSAAESAFLLLIIWYAWTWPTQEEAGT